MRKIYVLCEDPCGLSLPAVLPRNRVLLLGALDWGGREGLLGSLDGRPGVFAARGALSIPLDRLRRVLAACEAALRLCHP